MPSIPRVTGGDAIRAFSKHGFELDRVHGSHHILVKAGHRWHLSIPMHGNQIVGLGLLRRQIMNAGITVEDFIEALG